MYSLLRIVILFIFGVNICTKNSYDCLKLAESIILYGNAVGMNSYHSLAASHMSCKVWQLQPFCIIHCAVIFLIDNLFMGPIILGNCLSGVFRLVFFIIYFIAFWRKQLRISRFIIQGKTTPCSCK